MSTVTPAIAATPNLLALIDALQCHTGQIPLGELLELQRRHVITREDIADFAIFDAACYRRNRIFLSADVELLALCWRSGQRSPIHDHTGSACAVRVISGVASETTFERSPSGLLFAKSTIHNPAGAVCGSIDADIHQMGNLQREGEDLVTLHAYSPPLRHMKTYFCGDAVMGEYLNPLDALTRGRSGRLVAAARRAR